MITLLIITMILSFLGKGKAENPPSGPVTYLQYKETGMRYCIQYTYEQHEDGSYSLTRERDWNEAKTQSVPVPASVGEQLWKLVEEHKMYNYKSSYTPSDDIKDGIMWHLEARFADGGKLYTGGDNTWPDGKGIQRMGEYLEGLWKRYKEAADAGKKVLPAAPEPKFPPDVCKMEYKVRGTVMYPLTYFLLEKEKDDERYWLVNGSNCAAYDARRVEVPKSFVDSIRQIVVEEKMLEYKRDYQPSFQVLDGVSWDLYIGFEYSRTSVYSSGHEEYPDGDGLSRLSKLCQDTWKNLEAKAEPYPIEN